MPKAKFYRVICYVCTYARIITDESLAQQLADEHAMQFNHFPVEVIGPLKSFVEVVKTKEKEEIEMMEETFIPSEEESKEEEEEEL